MMHPASSVGFLQQLRTGGHSRQANIRKHPQNTSCNKRNQSSSICLGSAIFLEDPISGKDLVSWTHRHPLTLRAESQCCSICKMVLQRTWQMRRHEQFSAKQDEGDKQRQQREKGNPGKFSKYNLSQQLGFRCRCCLGVSVVSVVSVV